MIFAAGIGSRLQPLTNKKPKALVEYKGKTLLQNAIETLVGFGFYELVVNVHHFANQIVDFLKQDKFSHLKIDISDETHLLCDTGGGLRKAVHLLGNEPFVAYNVDIITDLDIQKFYQSHIQSGAVATVAVMHRSTGRYFLFDNEMRMCGWMNKKTGESNIRIKKEGLKPLAFSGVHVFSPDIFDILRHENVFSITDDYLRLCANHLIMGYEHSHSTWIDIGKEEHIPFLS